MRRRSTTTTSATPAQRSNPEAYRYGVRFRFPDQFGNTVYRDVFVESTRTLTINQIVNAAEALYSELAPQYGRFATLPISDQIEARILTAERRT